MKTRFHRLSFAALTAGSVLVSLQIIAPTARAAEVIHRRSGWINGASGSVGQLEDDIFFDPTNVIQGPFNTTFGPSDFSGASGGSLATVVSPHPAWIQGLSADPDARWVNWAGGGAPGTVLYAMPFTVATTSITSATLTLHWSADDTLGGLEYNDPANTIGAYINGQATTIAGGNYAVESSATFNIPVSMLNAGGVNELYLYQRDGGQAVSGIIFSAEFNIIPSPGPLAILALAGSAAIRRRR